LIGIDQQVDASVLVLPDHVAGLGHRTDSSAHWAFAFTASNASAGSGASSPDEL
jgi:hypothetical protein